MTKLPEIMFNGLVDADDIKKIIEKELGPSFSVILKQSANGVFINVIQDAARGCSIHVREKNGRTVCGKPSRFLPSRPLWFGIGIFATIFSPGIIITALMLGADGPRWIIHLGIVIGAVAYASMYGFASKALVQRLTGILRKAASLMNKSPADTQSTC